jgi:UDP-N-acetylmuramoyl-tripeptide--D-alanyl-D-alanine ligase
MGLSMTVNQRIRPGVDVFIAEMGTYGTGEIRRLCDVFPPDIAAITTIGEAHLARMKDRATIVRAKSEITEKAKAIVLNVDIPELDELAAVLSTSKSIVRCSSSDISADVTVLEKDGQWLVYIGGTLIGKVDTPKGAHATNLAIAVGIAIALDEPPSTIAKSIRGLPNPPHRAEVNTANASIHIIDDTYNANPVGAQRAIELARSFANATNTVWTITPGMVELGQEQVKRNRELAAAATAAPNMVLVVTCRTNRRALLSGAATGARTRVYANRVRARDAVFDEVEPGDVVLYENDLPDHYP